MKKYFYACAVFAMALSVASCGTSKESAYRKAYEKAKAQEMAQQQGQQVYGQQQYVQQDPAQYQQQYQQPIQQQQPVQQYQQPVQQYQQPVQQPAVTQLVEAPVQQQVAQAPVAQAPASQAPVAQANTSNGSLKAHSVVVGAFSVRANAEGLVNTLRNAGYSGAQVTYDGKLYRVVASTHDTRDAAVRDQSALKATYPSAWILDK